MRAVSLQAVRKQHLIYVVVRGWEVRPDLGYDSLECLWPGFYIPPRDKLKKIQGTVRFHVREAYEVLQEENEAEPVSLWYGLYGLQGLADHVTKVLSFSEILDFHDSPTLSREIDDYVYLPGYYADPFDYERLRLEYGINPHQQQPETE
jgi:hypothetical protein